MVVYSDSREKKNDHILAYLERHGIPYEVRKLDIGDYQLDIRPGRTIDRKRDLEEMARNMCTGDKTRFWREVRLSHSRHVKMIVLIEQQGVTGIEDVRGWHSKYSRITGQYLAREMYRCHIAYGVEFLFCSKRSTGKRIVELLTE